VADEVQAHVRGERADEVALACLEALGRARVQIRRALELARHPRVLGRRDVAPVRLRPDLAQEGEEALGTPPASSWSHSTGSARA
jgi:hypothetical protein